LPDDADGIRTKLAGELRCICAVLHTTTDDDDAINQRPLLVWPLDYVLAGQ